MWNGEGGEDANTNTNTNTHSNANGTSTSTSAANVGEVDDRHEGEGAWEMTMPMASDPSTMSNCL
jgi:hypothetical protein